MMDNEDTSTNKRPAETIASSSKRPRIDRPKLSVSETDIEKMIKSKYYADKTEYAWRLIRDGGPIFCIRPRRFGKFLFIKTLNKICQGDINREIFKGTWIYNAPLKNKDGLFLDKQGISIATDEAGKLLAEPAGYD